MQCESKLKMANVS